MTIVWNLIKAFLVGGALCMIGEILLLTGVKRAVQEIGFLGAFTGGLTNTAAGISAAVFFGVLMALIFQPRAKE